VWTALQVLRQVSTSCGWEGTVDALKQQQQQQQQQQQPGLSRLLLLL
jgi:hypothetical protein